VLHRGNGRVRLERLFAFDGKAMWHLVKLSAGTIGQMLIGMTSWVVLMYIVQAFGPAAAAGYTTAIRILMFTLLPAWGLSNAAATLVGQNLGSKQPDRAERAVWLTGLYDMLFLMAVTLVMELLPELLIVKSGFVTDPEIAGHTIESLRIIAVGYPFFAWGMVGMQAFNGAGDTRTPTWLHFWCFWVLELPLAWLLAFKCGLGPRGVYWAIAACESLFAVAAMALFRRGRWKTIRV
jgi:Na+-driven multidrug efflux pump